MVELQRNAEVELERIAPVIDDLGRLFAEAGHELALVGGPVRDAMLGRPHTDLDFTTSARPDDTERLLVGLGRRDLGHGPRLRDHRVPQGRVDGRGDDVPLGGLRPRLPQAGRRLRRQPRGRPRPARLHRQRDGGAAAGPDRGGPVRRGGRPDAAAAADAGDAAGVVLRRPAADAAGGAVRGPARRDRGARGGRGDDRHGRPDRDHLGRAGPRRAGQADQRALAPARAGAARADRAGVVRAARAAGPRARARRAPPAQGRLRAHPHRAGAVDGPRGPAARRAGRTSSPGSPR